MRSSRSIAVAAVALFGAIAVMVTPASAQSAPPTITLSPAFAEHGVAPATWSIRVDGTGFWANRAVSIAFDGQNVTPSPAPTAAPNGTFSTVITPTRRGIGAYTVQAVNSEPCNPARACSPPRSASATFRSLSVTFDPACRPPSPVVLTVTADGFTPKSNGYVTIDPGGPEQQNRSRIPTNGGRFEAVFDTTGSGRSLAVTVSDLGGPELDTRWPACPPPTSSTTVIATTTTVASTTTTEGITTTVPTIVTIPAPTPGATLAIEPSLGPGGFVAAAKGEGFPPNVEVELRWSPGLGEFAATTAPDGTFRVAVLVMDRDVIGPRVLTATAGPAAANAGFLVVPSTVQPSGADVAQISRTRRFLQR